MQQKLDSTLMSSINIKIKLCHESGLKMLLRELTGPPDHHLDTRIPFKLGGVFSPVKKEKLVKKATS